MSQIANLLLVEAGETTIYYDHWAAYDLDRYLFWGPERSIDFIRAHQTITHYDWSPYAEAAALVDLDQKCLLFYGGELYFNPQLFERYAQLLRQSWSGYEVRFAYNGLIDLFDYLGMEDERFRQRISYPPLTDDAIAFYFQDYDRWENNYYTGLLSMREGDQLTLIPLHMPFMDDTEFLFAGDNFLNYARKFSGYLADRVATLFERDQYPEFGLHADYNRGILSYWQNGMGFLGDLDHQALAKRWPSWQLESWKRHSTRHLDAIDQPNLFPQLSQEAMDKALYEALVTHYPNRERWLHERVAEQGEDILLHPDHQRFVAFEIDKAAQIEYWQTLMAQEIALPPAKSLNDHS